jgi:hypothetical protein
MRTLRTFGAAFLTANCLVGNALGAACVGAEDVAALRTAALQQELMVAALTCHDINRYNQFVLSRRTELIDSDARLKAFFIHRSSEAGYHAYKTELANAASLHSIRRTDAFCSHADAVFDQATRRTSLAALLAARPVPLAAAYQPCERDVLPAVDDAAAPTLRRHARADAHSYDADARYDGAPSDIDTPAPAWADDRDPYARDADGERYSGRFDRDDRDGAFADDADDSDADE